MGVVVAATHVDLNQRVALKFLLPEAAGHADLIERFAREARAAAQIQSEHVARVIDVGTLDTGIPYMVMEYLEGQDLHDAQQGAPPIPVETAVGHVLHAAEAIAEAHSLGVVHRDLKPANLFLARRPNGTVVVKVLDFGISKSTLANDESGLTKASTMVGSPSYMAPEQIRSARSVDARADQWSLGIILYELLSGEKPFNAESIPELVFAILDKPHPPLLSLRADVPEGLVAVIDRCLAKEPSARFRNVAELARALVPFGPEWSFASAQRSAHVLGVGMELDATESSVVLLSVPQPTPPPSPPAGDPAVTGAPWSRSSSGGAVPLPPASPQRSLLAPIAIGMLGASALVGAVVFALGDGFSTPPAPHVLAAAPPVVTPPPPPPDPTPPRTVAAVAAETPPPVPPSTSPPPPSADVPAPHAAPRVKSVVAPKPSASAAAPHCATVTFFDSDGMKHFKQECK
jgi:serine/threonine-protein kinase